MKQVQSYMSVMLFGKFSVYQTRIFLKIVQRAQQFFKAEGKRYADFLQQAYSMDGYNVNFAVPVQEIVGEKCHNYQPLKEAIKDMERTWHVEYYDIDKKIWHATPVIFNVTIEEQSGILRFVSANWLIKLIGDFRKFGFRTYDYDVAMSLRNPNTAKLYLLTCSQDKPLTYNLEQMKKWLGVEGTYKRPADFARRCLDPAMKELEQKKVNGFNYEFIHEREGKKTSPIKGIKLIPIKREKKHIDAAQQRADIETSLPPNVVNYLSVNCGFSIKELARIKADLIAFCRLTDWEWKLTDIITRARQKRRNKGWIIRAIQSEVERNKGGEPE